MVFPLTGSVSAEGKRVYVICGPTASGKSSLAEQLAQSTDGIIINADSLQLTSSLPILTAQPSLEIQETIPHRLYGVYQAGERISAGVWLERALGEIEGAFLLNKVPIVVGGTGLYLKALLEGLSPMPEVCLELRQELNELFENEGKEALCARLALLDPGALEKYSDPQRLKRALEVVMTTGRSIFYYQNIKPSPPPYRFHKIGIDIEREVLRGYIRVRIEQMMERGVLEEVRKYMEECGLPTPAIGYQELKSYLLGEISLDEALRWTAIKTSQYAKRQATWFRNQMVYDECVKPPFESYTGPF